jgi:WWE domain
MVVSHAATVHEKSKQGKPQVAAAAAAGDCIKYLAAPPPPDKYRLSKDSNQQKTVIMASDVHSVWLWLADDESWERFDPVETAAIALAVSKGHCGAILHRGDTPYFIDLLRFTQTSVVSGTRRPIYNVQKGQANWLVQQQDHPSLDAVKRRAPSGAGLEEGWVSFSRKETQQLEDAFFSGSDFAVLNRDDGGSCYVDLARWTSTCLSSNATNFIKITSSNVDSAPIPHDISTTIVTNGSPQKHKKCLSDREASEGTFATPLAEDDDMAALNFDVDDDGGGDQAREGTIVVKDHRTSGTPRPRSQALWRWHNDSHDWTNFDDEFTDALERSWATGAGDMVFQRGHTQYYIDLQNLTQTNIDTGRARPIQRVSQRKKPSIY